VNGPRLDELIASNLAAVRSRVERAAHASARNPADIRLVAVSKTFSPDHVRAAAAAGQQDFGENRVQEAVAKIAATGDLALRWHLIGHLQSNKARKAIGPFAMIQSVDSLDLLRRLQGIAVEDRKTVEVLIQLDLAGEPTKSGLPPEELPGLLAAARDFHAVPVIGLMLLPPLFEDPENARPYFRRLRETRDRLLDEGTPPATLRELSMGMSHDFEVAVSEGATMIRVGTAIFGPRTAAG
jgi:pyridoxal phosphate enzyme (YggS family)